MPIIDLHTILAPIVAQVAGLVFPSVVDIEASDPFAQTPSGAPADAWDTLFTDVPALVTPTAASTGAERAALGATMNETDVVITLAGDLTVPLDARVVVQGTADVWQVIEVQHDEARVTTLLQGMRYTGPVEVS